MRVPTYHYRRDAHGEQSMTPLIDVVFLLLIFFVCASVGQVRESLLPTELAPGTVQALDPTEREPWVAELWLRLRRNELNDRTIVELNEREYEKFDALKNTLGKIAELGPESPVILDIAPAVPLADMIRVYDACRAANFESIHFATAADAGRSPHGTK